MHSFVNNNEIREFFFITGSANPDEIYTPNFDYTVGSWVKVTYDQIFYHGLIIDKKENQYQVKCLEKVSGTEFYAFENDNYTVWYSFKDIVEAMGNVPLLSNARLGYYKI